MTRHLPFVAIVCVALSACEQSAKVSPCGFVGDPSDDPAKDYDLAEPIRHGNLAIFPIRSKVPRDEDRFTTLSEGLKAGTVEIREVGAADRTPAPVAVNADASDESSAEFAVQVERRASDAADESDDSPAGNDVNRLVVINSGDKPLYLMPGEIIVGGSQDRTIGEETVIAATGEPVPIDVYCVEAGRWGLRDSATAAAVFEAVEVGDSDRLAMAQVARAGRFVATPGSLSKATRLAVQGAEGQGKVWESVGEANRASGVKWSSDAFTANYVDDELLGRLTPYVEALRAPVSDQERVVGVVVAINGKIETVDLFESTPLFRKLWPQLLKSFALDAIQNDDAEDAESAATPEQARTFLAGVIRDQAGADRKTKGGLVVSKRETKEAVSFSASAMGGGMGMGGGGMGGGFGGAIHAAGFAQ